MRKSSLTWIGLLAVLVTAQLGCLVATDIPPVKTIIARQGSAAGLPCPIFPANSVWNTPIDNMLVDEKTPAMIGNMNPQGNLQAGFNSGRSGADSGIVFMIIGQDQPKVNVFLMESEESDHGPFPIPDKVPIEHSASHRLVLLDVHSCFTYEFSGLHRDAEQQWVADTAAIFDLRSHILRRVDWVSADAAGLAILPGLVRYDEVASGSIAHALRFSTPRTRKMYLWPARHSDSNIYDAGYPPMGMRFRLKANFRLNDFSQQSRVILRALQTYGMFVADNGPAWTISGAPDPRWNDLQLAELNRVPASAFEAIDESPLMQDLNLGLARQDIRPEELSRPAEKPAEAQPAEIKPAETPKPKS